MTGETTTQIILFREEKNICSLQSNRIEYDSIGCLPSYSICTVHYALPQQRAISQLIYGEQSPDTRLPVL